jgi:hypothetical protein
MKRIATAIASGIAVSALAAGDGGRGPIRVYVTAAVVESQTALDRDRGTLRARLEQARQMRRAMENDLKDQYGRTRASWPEERLRALGELEDTEDLAQADYEYRKADGPAVREAARALAAALPEGKAAGRVTVTDAAAEADLLVEVTATRTAKSFPTQERPDVCYVLFVLSRGDGMDPGRYARIPATYRTKRLGTRTWRIAGASPEKPVFYFESHNDGGNQFGCQAAAAGAASAAVDRFIEDNYGVLTAN